MTRKELRHKNVDEEKQQELRRIIISNSMYVLRVVLEVLATRTIRTIEEVEYYYYIISISIISYYYYLLTIK